MQPPIDRYEITLHSSIIRKHYWSSLPSTNQRETLALVCTWSWDLRCHEWCTWKKSCQHVAKGRNEWNPRQDNDAKHWHTWFLRVTLIHLVTNSHRLSANLSSANETTPPTKSALRGAMNSFLDSKSRSCESKGLGAVDTNPASSKWSRRKRSTSFQPFVETATSWIWWP